MISMKRTGNYYLQFVFENKYDVKENAVSRIQELLFYEKNFWHVWIKQVIRTDQKLIKDSFKI